jgi:hypothetical protein
MLIDSLSDIAACVNWTVLPSVRRQAVRAESGHEGFL